MREIDGHPKNLRDLLFNTKYTVNYYQREYMWRRKQIEELVDDLTSEFLNYYDPNKPRTSIASEYSAYFMGSIVITDTNNAIIDGQQRLTSLTLLLIYVNRRLRKQGKADSAIDGMIYSEQYGIKSFNINVEDRTACLESIYNRGEFDPEGANESSRHIWERYNDIIDVFPEEIDDKALQYFADWLMEKVYFIRIVAGSEQDAQRVFVSMNDRGLNLTPTEMLKGYLLSEINDDAKREQANTVWKNCVDKLKTLDSNKSEDESFIKDWLRAQYAETIRETKAGSVNLDFDLIGTEFHKWVRENSSRLGLRTSEDFEEFIEKFEYFCNLYLKIKGICDKYNERYRYIYYNHRLDFTLQTQLLLAPVCYGDTSDIVDHKLEIVAKFIDMYIYARTINYKSVNYSTIKNYIFNITKKIRRLDCESLSAALTESFNDLEWRLDTVAKWELNSFTKKYIHHFIARLTSYLERNTDKPDNYVNYVDWRAKNPFEVEHITPDKYEWFTDEYPSENDFSQYRNNVGDLLLLPKSLNASLQEQKYEYKVDKYCSADGNIYSESLNEKAYQNNPRFVKFANDNNLDFKSYQHFGKNEILERSKLVKEIAAVIWNTDNLR